MPYTRVQQASDGGNTATLTVSLGAGPAQGNLLVAWANSDSTVTIGGSGWSAGPSIIDGNGAYTWFKIAGAGEPGFVAFTPGGGADYIGAGVIEYSGAFASAAVSLDQSTSVAHTASATFTTGTASVTPTTWNDLIIAVACLHQYATATADPTAPAWTGGLANLQSQNSSGFTGHSTYTFYADLTDTGQGTATVSANCTWATTQTDNAQLLVLAFQSPGKDIALGAAASTAAAAARAPGKAAAASAATTPTLARAAARSATATATGAAGTTRGLARTTSATATTTAAATRAPGRILAAAASVLAGLARALTRSAQAAAAATAGTSRTPARKAAATTTTAGAVTATSSGIASNLRVIAARAVARWSAREGGAP